MPVEVRDNLFSKNESGLILKAAKGLTLALYKILIEAKTPLFLPLYKGSTFRGAFGHSFKKIVCLNIGTALCQRCKNDKCVYGYVFETSPGETANKLKNLMDIPRPFVIEPPKEKRKCYKPGDRLEFTIVIFGKAIQFLPYFILAFKEMGDVGIGQGRGQFSVVRVEDHAGRQVYDANSDVVVEDIKELPWIEEIFEYPDDVLCELQMSFLTPTRIKIRNDLIVRPEFHVLIRSLLHRISSIMCFHCDSELNIDFRSLIAEAEKVSIKKSDVYWMDWERFSSRQETRMKLGGFGA